MTKFELATPCSRSRSVRSSPCALTHQGGRHPGTFLSVVLKAFSRGIYSCSKKQLRYHAALSLNFNICSFLRWFFLKLTSCNYAYSTPVPEAGEMNRWTLCYVVRSQCFGRSRKRFLWDCIRSIIKSMVSRTRASCFLSGLI